MEYLVCLRYSDMRKLSFSLLVLITLLSNMPAQQIEQSPWVTLAPEGAGFTISVPAEVTARLIRRLPTRCTRLPSPWAAPLTSQATAITSPANSIAKTALTANRDKFNKSLYATLKTSREITLDGHSGLEFTSETPAAEVKSQLFLIGNRIFQTATFVFKDVDETRNVNRFFESFKFTARTMSYLMTPCNGLDALAYNRFGIRPAR